MTCSRQIMKPALFLALLATARAATGAPQFAPVDSDLSPDLFVWTATRNVRVLRDGDAALLIDLDDGNVLIRRS
jgi:hypothetical protein